MIQLLHTLIQIMLAAVLMLAGVITVWLVTESRSYVARTVLVGTIGVVGFHTLYTAGYWQLFNVRVGFVLVLLGAFCMQIAHAHRMRTSNRNVEFHETIGEIQEEYRTDGSKIGERDG